jgi:hypothetical protein
MQDHRNGELELGSPTITPTDSKDLKQSDVIGPLVVQTDAVFGEITADGPNYRSVSRDLSARLSRVNKTGRMDQYLCTHDQDSNGSWCPLAPFHPRYTGYGPWSDLYLCHWLHGNV